MLPESLQNLIDELSKLPGIGPKSAARLAFYLLTKPDGDVLNLGESITNLKKNLKYCSKCFNITEQELCKVCVDDKRNQGLLAVVEEPLDIIALEKSGGFSGIYHVLGGAISPIDGIGPEDLRIVQLINRISDDGIEEIILATNPSLEGEATASYIKDQIGKKGIKISITRIARGLPVGGDLEYADEVTLRRSLEGRRDYI
jgi:recombination protein RecR